MVYDVVDRVKTIWKCMQEPMTASSGSRIISRGDNTFSFRRQLTELAPAAAAPLAGSPSSEAPLADAPEEAAAITGDIDAKEPAEDDKYLWFLDFDNPITISLVALACLGAILCSGLGCVCCALCCGKSNKNQTSSKRSEDKLEARRGTETQHEALPSEVWAHAALSASASCFFPRDLTCFRSLTKGDLAVSLSSRLHRASQDSVNQETPTPVHVEHQTWSAGTYQDAGVCNCINIHNQRFHLNSRFRDLR